MTDQDVITSEELHKAAAEEEDASTMGMPAHSEMLRCCGIRIDFMLAMTFELDMWDWPTWKVVTTAPHARFSENFETHFRSDHTCYI